MYFNTINRKKHKEVLVREPPSNEHGKMWMRKPLTLGRAWGLRRKQGVELHLGGCWAAGVTRVRVFRRRPLLKKLGMPGNFAFFSLSDGLRVFLGRRFRETPQGTGTCCQPRRPEFNPRTHLVQEEKGPLQTALWFPLVRCNANACVHRYTHVHTSYNFFPLCQGKPCMLEGDKRGHQEESEHGVGDFQGGERLELSAFQMSRGSTDISVAGNCCIGQQLKGSRFWTGNG